MKAQPIEHEVALDVAPLMILTCMLPAIQLDH
jgi:hypothetical protein